LSPVFASCVFNQFPRAVVLHFEKPKRTNWIPLLMCGGGPHTNHTSGATNIPELYTIRAPLRALVIDGNKSPPRRSVTRHSNIPLYYSLISADSFRRTSKEYRWVFGASRREYLGGLEKSCFGLRYNAELDFDQFGRFTEPRIFKELGVQWTVCDVRILWY